MHEEYLERAKRTFAALEGRPLKDYFHISSAINKRTKGMQSYRSVFMRDRDRILYSRNLLRLSGKTQVYGDGHDDHARNRLTHSLEVAQIGRTIAKALNLDQDLAEAIALGHDLGHTPFGHAGERTIDAILCYQNKKINSKLGINRYLADEGEARMRLKLHEGFKHNWQSLRILEDLSRSYKDFSMDLTVFALSGILFHSTLTYGKRDIPAYYSKYLERLKVGKSYIWCGECLAVAIADKIAQRHHDIEDALSCNYLTPKRILDVFDLPLQDYERRDLVKDMPEFADADVRIFDLILKANKIKGATRRKVDDYISDRNMFIQAVPKYIVNWLTDSYIKRMKKLLADPTPLKNPSMLLEADAEEGEQLKVRYNQEISRLTGFDGETRLADKLLQYRLKNVILNSRSVKRMDGRGEFIIKRLFEAYITSPQQMSDSAIEAVFREYLKGQGNPLAFARPLFDDPAQVRVTFEHCYTKESWTHFCAAQGERVEVDRLDFKLALLRAVADYVAGMTDSYAGKEYQKLYGVCRDMGE